MPLIFFTFSQSKQFATQKQFRKSNRQYLKNQQTVLSSPDPPCQTVLKFPEIHARQFEFFRLFIHPWPWVGGGQNPSALTVSKCEKALKTVFFLEKFQNRRPLFLPPQKTEKVNFCPKGRLLTAKNKPIPWFGTFARKETDLFALLYQFWSKDMAEAARV